MRRAQSARLPSFAARLRDLRLERRLSLRQAARCAREITADSAGALSHDYIHRLEHGELASIPLAKLLALAAVYGTTVESLIAALPDDLRVQRLADLQDWTARQRPIPKPLPAAAGRTRSDAELDELLAACVAEGVQLDWQFKRAAEREARGFLPYAILPALLRQAPAWIEQFWASSPRDDLAVPWTTGPLHMRAANAWEPVTDEAVFWATRVSAAIVSAVQLVSGWGLDLATSLASCHFGDAQLDAEFGFDGVPPAVVIGTRRWQLAQLLYTARPRPHWPPPPTPLEGARAFVEYVLRPGPFHPEHAPSAPPSASSIYTELAALLGLVPALRSRRDPSGSSLARAVAQFLNRAAAPPTRRRAKPK